MQKLIGSIGCTPLINRVRRHLASQCFEIDNLDALPCLSKCQNKCWKWSWCTCFLCYMCSIVSFLNILAQKEQYFLEMWNLRLVLFSNFTGSTVVCCRELAFLEIEPTPRLMLAEVELHSPTKNTACGMGNILIFQEMLDFSTPGSFKLVIRTFLYMLFNTVQYMRLN